MVPGVQSDRYTEQAGGTSAGRTGGISVHGNRSLQNNFLLDGVANNSFSTNVQELTTQISRPSVDAIDEFKVVTSPYAAEYRLVARGGDYREHESRCQHVSRHRVRLFSRRPIRLEQLLCQGRESTEARQQSEPVRRQFRRPDWPAGVLLCRLRRHPHRAGRAANGNGDDGRSAARRLHDGDSRSAHAAAVPEQHDPGESDRSGRRLDHGARPVAQHHRRQQLHPPAERRGPVGPLSGSRRHPDWRGEQRLRPLHRERSLPLRPRLVRRRARRHLDIGMGQEQPGFARRRRRLEQGDRVGPGQRVTLLVRARHQRRHAGSVR